MLLLIPEFKPSSVVFLNRVLVSCFLVLFSFGDRGGSHGAIFCGFCFSLYVLIEFRAVVSEKSFFFFLNLFCWKSSGFFSLLFSCFHLGIERARELICCY